VLKIFILPLNFSKIGVFDPNFALLDKKFRTRRNFLTAPNLGRGNCPYCPRHGATGSCGFMLQRLRLISNPMMSVELNRG